MSNPNHDVQAEVRRYLVVSIELVSLTAIAVCIKFLHLSMGLSIFLTLSLSIIQAGLSACYFMHLISEKKVIFMVLIMTLSVFVGFGLFFLGHYSLPEGSTYVP